MKRNISLYIGGAKVDLSNDSLILYNYTAEQLSNPTIVKNEYSQQITLQGTERNNRIFGGIFKLDRNQLYTNTNNATGVNFDASRKTAFVVYDGDDVVESGYVKLDNVKNTNGKITYSISLYGGLGSFFYGLSYDNEGNPLTLASLDFGEDLSFNINAQNITDAWRVLNGGATIAKWQILNFAPCYNGYPEDFAKDKVILRADNAGLQTSVTEDGKTYTTQNGYVIAQLERDYTALEMQDFRSYLQRPILSVKKMIEAICNPANNGGYTVELDPLFFNDNNPYWARLWMSLPMFSSLPKQSERVEQIDVDYIGDYRFDSETTYDVITAGSFGNEATIDIKIGMQAEVGITNPPQRLYMSSTGVDPNDMTGKRDVQYFIFAEVVAMSGSTIVGGAPVMMFQTALPDGKFNVWTPQQVANLTGYAPLYPSSGYNTNLFDGTFDLRGEFDALFTNEASNLINGEGVTNVSCNVTVVRVETYTDADDNVIDYEHSFEGLQLFTSQTDTGSNVEVGLAPTAVGTFTQRTSTNIRSGALITQKMLLNSEKTPAQYLISYCKLFGLTFLADKVGKKISIMARNTLYGDSDVIDLTDKIDTGKEIALTPFVFETKYYNMGYGDVKGQYAEVYKETYNTDYGDKKINTGYEFDSQTKELLTDNAYNAVVEVLEKSKAFVNVTTSGGKIVPAAFLDGGQYTLRTADGDTKEIDIPVPNSNSSLVYFNDDFPTYDLFSKAQFHEAENKPLDMTDVLLFFQGVADVSVKYPSLRVTDDTGEMTVLNEGESCWLWRASTFIVSQLPMFGRYMWNNAGEITHSIDFGTPKELDMPQVVHPENVAVYPRFWQSYISDRYDVNSRVMTAYVDLSGLVVDRNLLRRFFYYEGALWVLNKIINYSITSYDRTQCEFVKVIDIDNYNNGINI